VAAFYGLRRHVPLRRYQDGVGRISSATLQDITWRDRGVRSPFPCAESIVMLANRVSSCVNCATPIIGDRRHCAACHAKYGDELLAGEVVDDAATLPRPRLRKTITVWQSLVAWLVIAQAITAVVILFILAGKGCS
jgi:hypothetical protein